MEIKKSFQENKALYVKEKQLSYLHNFLKGYFKNINYKAECSDDSTIEFQSLEELFTYENPKFRRIDQLEILADNKGRDKGFYNPFGTLDKEFELQLGVKYSSRTISYKLSFQDLQKVNSFETELKDRIKNIRPWYWPFVKFNFATGIFIIWFLISFLGGVYSLKQKFEGNLESSQVDLSLNEIIVVSIIGIGITYAIAYPLNKVKEYVFPRSIIEIGEEKEVSKFRFQVVYIILTVVLLGVGVGLVSNYLFRFLEG